MPDQKSGAPTRPHEDMARLSPLGSAHVNFLGRYACHQQPDDEDI